MFSVALTVAHKNKLSLFFSLLDTLPGWLTGRQMHGKKKQLCVIILSLRPLLSIGYLSSDMRGEEYSRKTVLSFLFRSVSSLPVAPIRFLLQINRSSICLLLCPGEGTSRG